MGFFKVIIDSLELAVMKYSFIVQKLVFSFLFISIFLNRAIASDKSIHVSSLGSLGGFKKAIMSSEIPGYGFRHPFVAYRRGKHLRSEEASIRTEERTVHQVEDSEEFLLVDIALRDDFLERFPNATEGWIQKVLTEDGEIEAVHFAANIPGGFVYKTRKTIKIINHWYELIATPRHLYHTGPWMNIGETYLELEKPLGLEYIFSLEKKYFEE